MSNNQDPASTFRLAREQGRHGLKDVGIDNAFLSPDTDGDRNVYVLVYAPRLPESTVCELHWSLAWEVSSGWRHVHVELIKYDNGRQLTHPRYVYWGPMTKTGGASTVQAEKILVARMSLSQRKKVEEIAQTIPVVEYGQNWNCQCFVMSLLGEMANNRLISSDDWARVLSDARRGKFCYIFRMAILSDIFSAP